MPYTRNIAFTALIKVNGRLREFNFRRRHDSLYDGDTNDERGERYFFKVEKVNQDWKLPGISIPAWLTQHEVPITEAIIKQEKEISIFAEMVAKK